jgi:thiol:disulfide interchange protein DsbC
MIPILGGDGQAKIDNIWCSKDRTQAWRDWMLNKTQPDQVACSSSPSQRNLDLSQKLGINGTPAAFFEDGSRLPGYEAAAGIEQRLKKAMFKVAG